MPTDPIECFQIATCYIAEGDYAGALPLMARAARAMAGNPDFDKLHEAVKAKA